MTQRRYRPALAGCFAAGLWLAIALPATAAEAEQQQAQADTGGAKTCLQCHNKAPTNLILMTPHAQTADSRTPFAGQQCQTCHGPSEKHLAGQGLPDIMFGKDSDTPVQEQNKVCLGCHSGGKRMLWAASTHNAADEPCSSCHKPHSRKDAVLVKASQPEVCFDCHFEQRAQSRKRSRHPIREGKVVCSNCHNPHGSAGRAQLAKNTVNETCYQCHAEKRGPFLWEHAPVTDDCTNCHNPHGSSQPRLLTVRTPYLCQTCHSEQFHPSTLRSGNEIPPVGAGDRLLAKGCLNCHPKVHGTNHPSGPRLTR